MATPFKGSEITPEHIDLAQAFLRRDRPAVAPNTSIPIPPTRPMFESRPVTSRLPLSPNMISFVRSPEGAALMGRLLASPPRRATTRGTQINSVGIV